MRVILNNTKGVFCVMYEDEQMPVDAHGNRADMIMDPNATFSRMNIGRFYEHFINAAARDAVREMKIQMGYGVKPVNQFELANRPLDEFNMGWNRLMQFYKIVSPDKMHAPISQLSHDEKAAHLAYVFNKKMYLYIPPDNQPETLNIVKELKRDFNTLRQPVSYIGNSGKRVVTVDPVIIGSMYILLLEKTGDDWTAVPSGKLQTHGVLSTVTNSDKYAYPARQQAIRSWGETEFRLLNSYGGFTVTAEIIDRNNNPATHDMILDAILYADFPTRIERAVDRTKHAFGGAKPLQLVKHFTQCAGWEYDYAPHNPDFSIKHQTIKGV